MKDTSNDKRIVYGGYARKSSESEDRQVQSIETQIEHLLELQQKEKFLVYQSPIKEEQSAFVPGRPGFNQLVAWTYEGKVNAWYCYHANRLSRNPIDTGTIIHLMDIGKLDHIRTPTKVYRNNPTDKMMLQFEFMMSKKDSDDKSIFVRDGLDRRYKKGFPTGKAPIGYLNDKTKEKGDRDWLVDEERLEKVRMILKRFLKGQDSIYSITRYARNELHLRTVQGKRIGGAYITSSGMELLLKNPVYAGVFYSRDENGKTFTKRELHPSLPRIISYSEHLKIVAFLGRKSVSKMQKHKATYTDFIQGEDGAFIGADHKFQLICDCRYKFAYRNRSQCPKCGIAIASMKTPKYLSYTYYYNVKRSKSRGTKTKRMEEKKVDYFLFDYFQNHVVMSPEIYQWTLKYLDELNANFIKEQEHLDKSVTSELSSTNKKLERLKEMYLNEMIDEKSYSKEYDTLRLKKETLLNHKENSESMDVAFKETLSMITEIKNIIENNDPEAKRELLSRLSSNLIWDEEKLNILRPKWLIEFEKARKRMLMKYPLFEPKKHVGNKEDFNDFGTLCPALLRRWRNVRTLFLQYHK